MSSFPVFCSSVCSSFGLFLIIFWFVSYHLLVCFLSSFGLFLIVFWFVSYRLVDLPSSSFLHLLRWSPMSSFPVFCRSVHSSSSFPVFCLFVCSLSFPNVWFVVFRFVSCRLIGPLSSSFSRMLRQYSVVRVSFHPFFFLLSFLIVLLSFLFVCLFFIFICHLSFSVILSFIRLSVLRLLSISSFIRFPVGDEAPPPFAAIPFVCFYSVCYLSSCRQAVCHAC